jgi:hypothetical protein
MGAAPSTTRRAVNAALVGWLRPLDERPIHGTLPEVDQSVVICHEI